MIDALKSVSPNDIYIISTMMAILFSFFCLISLSRENKRIRMENSEIKIQNQRLDTAQNRDKLSLEDEIENLISEKILLEKEISLERSKKQTNINDVLIAITKLSSELQKESCYGGSVKVDIPWEILMSEEKCKFCYDQEMAVKGCDVDHLREKFDLETMVSLIKSCDDSQDISESGTAQEMKFDECGQALREFFKILYPEKNVEELKEEFGHKYYS